MRELSKMEKVGAWFALSVVLIIILGFMGVYTTGPSRTREGWWGQSTKSNSPGRSVYFNYSVQVEGGNDDFAVEFRDMECEWEHHITPRRLTVQPGETRNITLEVIIPEDVEVGDDIRIFFRILTWRESYGFEMSSGEGTESLRVQVIDEEVANQRVVFETWDITSESFSGGGLDLFRFFIIVYFVFFMFALLIFVVPGLGKKITSKKE